jgi:putative Holliday junction resolvase
MGAQEGRILGLDLGSKRIGLALSDVEFDVALPEGTLERKGLPHDLAALRRLAEERGVTRIVVGLPIRMNGRRGPEAIAAEAFAKALAEATGLPVEMQDERWTTVEAQRALHATGNRARESRAHVDAVAASLLLRAYLDRRRNTP